MHRFPQLHVFVLYALFDISYFYDMISQIEVGPRTFGKQCTGPLNQGGNLLGRHAQVALNVHYVYMVHLYEVTLAF